MDGDPVVAALRLHVDREVGGCDDDLVVAVPGEHVHPFHLSGGKVGPLAVDTDLRVRAGLEDPNRIGPRGAVEGEDAGGGIEVDCRRDRSVFERFQTEARGGFRRRPVAAIRRLSQWVRFIAIAPVQLGSIETSERGAAFRLKRHKGTFPRCPGSPVRARPVHRRQARRGVLDRGHENRERPPDTHALLASGLSGALTAHAFDEQPQRLPPLGAEFLQAVEIGLRFGIASFQQQDQPAFAVRDEVGVIDPDVFAATEKCRGGVVPVVLDEHADDLTHREVRVDREGRQVIGGGTGHVAPVVPRPARETYATQNRELRDRAWS